MKLIKLHEVKEKLLPILDMSKVDRLVTFINAKLSDPTYLLENVLLHQPAGTYNFNCNGFFNEKDVEYFEKLAEEAGWIVNTTTSSYIFSVELMIK